MICILCVWNREPVVVEPHGGSVSWCQSSTSWIIPHILNVFGAAGPERSQTPPGRVWLHPIGVALSHEIVWNAVCSLQWGLIHGERQLSTHSYPEGCSRTATVWSLKFEWFGVQPAALGEGTKLWSHSCSWTPAEGNKGEAGWPSTSENRTR